jgi:hypothetical protein
MTIDCMDRYMNYLDDVLSRKAAMRKVQSHFCDHFLMNDQSFKVSFCFPLCHACPKRRYILHNEQEMMTIDCTDPCMNYLDDVLSGKAAARKVHSHFCDHF